jgi:tetratricopeptide (TPR) repeat protein
MVVRVLVLVASLTIATASSLRAQELGTSTADTLVLRALDLEESKPREAAALYRRAFAGAAMVPALLGLERVYTNLGMVDSLLPLVRSAIRAEPRSGVVRTVQLRALTALQRDDELSAAFRDWVRAVPGEAAPFKEYARILLESGRSQAADSVLTVAARMVRDPRDFSSELAQVASAQGMWNEAARRWRETLTQTPQLYQAALFALAPARGVARDSIRTVLLAEPLWLPARRALGSLELVWLQPRQAWQAFSGVKADAEAVAAWKEFAEEADARNMYVASREAWAAIHRKIGDAASALRAADAALASGEASAALQLASSAQGTLTPQLGLRDAVPVRLRALAALGRAGDALALVDSVRPKVVPLQLQMLERELMWAWLRVGDLDQARTALRNADASNTLLLLPRALLSRTTLPTSTALGAAFSALARRDTAAALTQLLSTTTEVGDAAPLVLAMSARLLTASNDDARAVPLWTRIVTEYSTSPEAPEGDLEWARAALRARDEATAIARLEHLLLTYPTSALAPQARRELETARRTAGAS